MAKEGKDSGKVVPLREGYQPEKRGYQPTQGNLEASNPPRGGSGVPPRASGGNAKDGKKD